MSENALPRGLGERLLSLRSFSLLAALPTADLAQMARLSRERDFQAGEILAIRTESVRTVLLLISGRATLSCGGVPVGTAGAFDTVGLLPIAAGIPHHLTVVAIEPIHALEIDADLVDEVLEDDFALFVRVLQLAAASVDARRGGPTVQPGILRGGGEGHNSPMGDAQLVCELSGPLAVARKLLVLREAPLFRMAPVDGLAAFAKRLELVRLPAGQHMEAGGVRGELSVIVAGRAEVSATAVGPGDVVGALEALTANGSPLLLHAQTELHLLRGAAADLLDVIEDHQTMGRRLMAEIVALNTTL